MENEFDFITIGDSTVDQFLEITDGSAFCNLDTKNCFLALSWAEKIPVDRLTKVAPAGNSANAAVGASRLGLKVAFYTELGSDDDGAGIAQALQREGVSGEYLNKAAGAKTNFSTVIVYQKERVILVYHYPRTYRWPQNLEKANWLYLSSMAKGCEVIYDPMLEYVSKNKTKLAFNPGTYQLAGKESDLIKIIKSCEVLIVNKEEMAKILKSPGDADFKELLAGGQKMGPKIVVVTDAMNGSYTYDGQKFLKIGIFDEPVLERTGAGDSYTIGFLSAIAKGKSVMEAMRWGTANSASVVGKIGPQAGLLTQIEMDAMLKKYPYEEAKEF